MHSEIASIIGTLEGGVEYLSGGAGTRIDVPQNYWQQQEMQTEYSVQKLCGSRCWR
jgi:hypothetical protein